jgi:hypothetical protein
VRPDDFFRCDDLVAIDSHVRHWGHRRVSDGADGQR